LLKEDGWRQKDALKPYALRIRDFIRKDFSRSPLWAVKDPTICRLLPWWLTILAAEQITPHFLFVVRAPRAVAQSLERRDGFAEEKSLLLWVLHYLEAEKWSRPYARAFMDFDRFLEAPVAELQRIEGALRLTFPVPPSSARQCLDDLLSADLRHFKDEDGPPKGSLVRDLAGELHARLLNAARSAPGMPEAQEMDVLWQRMADLQDGFPSVLMQHLRDVSRPRGQAQLVVKRCLRSWSWHTGKPLRYLERILGRDV
jgi:hypothetical protein